MSREVSYQVVIDIPCEKAWEIMQDISIAHKYVPGIIKTDMHTQQTQGVGASRRVFKRMMALDETITEWNEGSGFTLRLHDGEKSKPFPDAYFIYKIDTATNNTTVFTATMGYSLSFGILGRWVDNLFIHPIVKSEIRSVALALKYFYETGNTPSKADLKRLKKVA